MLKPDAYFEKITDIDYEYLKQHNIRGLILDVDNTLLDLDEKPIEGIKEWVNVMKNNNLKICIASNSVRKTKLDRISNQLDVKYFRLSCKPFKRGLKKAQKEIKLDSESIAEIGDQLFTDVWGAKRMKMFAILVKPISEEKYAISRFKRKIEKKFLE